MKKYVHLNFEDRTVIEALIRLGYSCKNIAKELSRSESTIRREIKNNRTMTKPNLFNNYSPGYCGCSSRFPYVCNNCPMKNGNKVYKYFYTSTKAQENYELSLSFSRTGSNFDNQTMKRIDAVVVDGLSKNQSVYHIIEANSLPVSVSSIYRWVKEGLLSPKPIDLRKAIKYRTKDSRPKRAKNAVNRRDRTYKDYLIYVSDNPSVNMIEMDTVEGLKSDKKCLLTFACIKSGLLFSRLLASQTNINVVKALNELELSLGIETFKKFFGVILTDNGSEFSDAGAIEYSPYTKERRTRLFYCDPQRSDQKGTIERKHVDVRCIIPKGKSIEHLTNEKIDLMDSHINAILRPIFNDQSTYNFAKFLHGNTILKSLGITYIDPTQVELKPDLIK